jgi:hypothetical protein
MCSRLCSDCCGVRITGVKGLPLELKQKVELLYEGHEGEMLATCFCSKCGRPVCISCLN